VHIMTAVASLLLIVGLARAEEAQKAVAERAGPDALKAEIEALMAPRVAWREIAWKSCLIEGLKESRDKKKPVVLWVFIDRPADDGRC
jgi:hypothetical protein